MKNACSCMFAEVYYHGCKPLKFSYTCLNPACDNCGQETDPVFCALCKDRKEDDHGLGE